MTTALVKSRAQLGLQAPAVSVEVHLPSGLPAFISTGVSGGELRDRVKSAIQNSAFDFPPGRIVVNLGPAELPKSGGRYDLAIAAGILMADGQLPEKALKDWELLGELSLFGDVRPIRGILTAARETLAAGKRLLCPAANGTEFDQDQPNVLLIQHINQLARLQTLDPPVGTAFKPANAESGLAPGRPNPLQDVIGQLRPKRALTIAAAGGHHMLMMGAPGAGKTMLAKRLRDLLPHLQQDSRAEVAEIYSLSGLTPPKNGQPPFRAPHHSASSAALTGGGSPPQPGEISHAHNGVLFMDEMPEFRRDLIESLREPLEEGHIRISRRGFAVDYPARFQLIAAMNPCPFGLVCTPRSCRCPPDQAQRYRNRISAPIMDRIDLHINVAAVPVKVLLRQTPTNAEDSPAAIPPLTTEPDTKPAISQLPIKPSIQEIVSRTRNLQLRRSGALNAHLDVSQTERLCVCESGVIKLLEAAAERFELSARGYFRTLRVARTITDLDRIISGSTEESTGESMPITEGALSEALSYRAMPLRR